MARYEYRSRLVTAYDGEGNVIERVCNLWAHEGFFVFSVVCPNPSNYHTYQLTSRCDNEAGVTPAMFKDMP